MSKHVEMGAAPSTISSPPNTQNLACDPEGVVQKGGEAEPINVDIKPADVVESIFKALTVNQTLMCLDEFNSKYTGELLRRWREATIQEIISSTVVRIRFVGWSDKHDIQLNLDHEWIRLAPLDILSDEQIFQGLPLDKTQCEITYEYLTSGTLPNYENLLDAEEEITYEAGQLVSASEIPPDAGSYVIIFQCIIS